MRPAASRLTQPLRACAARAAQTRPERVSCVVSRAAAVLLPQALLRALASAFALARLD